MPCANVKLILSLWIASVCVSVVVNETMFGTDKRSSPTSPVGPPYPVTAAWFKDRWTIREWQDILDNFTSQGGDTVFLRAPPVIHRTKEAIERDANFKWCGNSTGSSGPKCFDEAVHELKAMGLNVAAFLTYQYEEGFSDDIMRCPKLDRKINSSRVYYRIVLPAGDSTYSKSDPCSFANGSNVVVLFTSFSGVDAHQILLEAASSRNVSVYFGLPAIPYTTDDGLMPAYYAWVEHVLFEHRSRFSKMPIRVNSASQKKGKYDTYKQGQDNVYKQGQDNVYKQGQDNVYKQGQDNVYKQGQDNVYKQGQDNVYKQEQDTVYKQGQDNVYKHGQDNVYKQEQDNVYKQGQDIDTTSKNVMNGSHGNVRGNKTLYDTLVGYNAQTDHSLGEWLFILDTVNLYELLGNKVNMVQKRYAVSATINLNRGQVNSTVEKHVEGFVRLVNTGVMDIIIVQEGRGSGKGAYFWLHQKHEAVAQIDPVLCKILRYQNQSISKHVTFDEVFIASNQEVFTAFKHALKQTGGWKWDGSVEFWLGQEAFEFLRDDPCLPIDPRGSGMGQLLNRASKQRIDEAIGVAGAKVQKVISFAWDSDFTCITNEYKVSLHSEIMADLKRPIISNCSFHSPQNLSVVVLGFNLEGETQGFKVEWKDTRGHMRTTSINGYYFELDYGVTHHLIASLQYVMLWDIPQMFPGLVPDGTISVATSGRNTCFFEYSLPQNDQVQ